MRQDNHYAYPKEIRKKIKLEAQTTELTQKQLAEKWNISKSTLLRYKNKWSRKKKRA